MSCTSSVDAEFLADLAPERLLGGLSGLHLAAEELPFATRIKARVASAGKVMIAVGNDGYHHVKHLQFGIEHASPRVARHRNGWYRTCTRG